MINKLSKYGKVDADDDYNDFYIYIDLNKETIDYFIDNEVIEKSINFGCPILEKSYD